MVETCLICGKPTSPHPYRHPIVTDPNSPMLGVRLDSPKQSEIERHKARIAELEAENVKLRARLDTAFQRIRDLEGANRLHNLMEEKLIAARDDQQARAEKAEARIAELELELHAMRGECSLAYGIIDQIPLEVLSGVSDAELLRLMRSMEEGDKRKMAKTSLDRERAALLVRAEKAEAALAECGEVDA